MKKILFVLFAVVLAVSALSFCVCAEEAQAAESDISEAVSELVSEEVSAVSDDGDALDTEVELEYNGFGNEGFLRNLKYMGLGMLGIFAVVGVVILITFVLNSATSKK